MATNPFKRLDLLGRLPSAEERVSIRRSVRWTLRDIATLLDTTPQTVHGWEGGGTPSDQYLAGYVELLERIQSASAEPAAHDAADPGPTRPAA